MTMQAIRNLEDLPPIVTIAEAAHVARCSASTIRRAIRTGLIKSSRAFATGASPHRILREDLIAWLNTGTQVQP